MQSAAVERHAHFGSLGQLKGGQRQPAIGQIGADIDPLRIVADEIAVVIGYSALICRRRA